MPVRSAPSWPGSEASTACAWCCWWRRARPSRCSPCSGCEVALAGLRHLKSGDRRRRAESDLHGRASLLGRRFLRRLAKRKGILLGQWGRGAPRAADRLVPRRLGDHRRPAPRRQGRHDRAQPALARRPGFRRVDRHHRPARRALVHRRQAAARDGPPRPAPRSLRRGEGAQGRVPAGSGPGLPAHRRRRRGGALQSHRHRPPSRAGPRAAPAPSPESRIVTANTQWQAGESRTLVRERLVTPDELMTLGPDRQYVIAAAKDMPRDAFGLHHARYWRRPDARHLADPNPFVLRKLRAERSDGRKDWRRWALAAFGGERT